MVGQHGHNRPASADSEECAGAGDSNLERLVYTVRCRHYYRKILAVQLAFQVTTGTRCPQYHIDERPWTTGVDMRISAFATIERSSSVESLGVACVAGHSPISKADAETDLWQARTGSMIIATPHERESSA
jgi:hypothetical protein